MKIFDPPSQEEVFYARALSVLSRPNRMLRTLEAIVKYSIWLLLLTLLSFVIEQVLDRTEPSTVISLTAEPRQVVAGQAVRIHTVIERHKRCDYQIEWSIVDAIHEVHHYGYREMRAPGAPGPDDYVLPYDTSENLPAGPATLLISLHARCPLNYLEKFWPLEIDMPGVDFEVISGPHDDAKAPHT